MDSTLTVRTRSLGLALGALVAVLVVVLVAVLSVTFTAYPIGATGGGGAPAAAAAPPPVADEARRSIVMAGAGEATGVPDQLVFDLSVSTRAADVATALGQANTTMRRVQAALVEAGVERRDAQTAGLSLRPVYDYSEQAPPTITGFAVSQRLGVLVRDLSGSGRAIAAAVEAGGNAVRLRGLRLEIGDLDTLLRQARDAAVAEATAKAEQYAAATGQRLAEVLSIEEVSTPRPRPVPVEARALQDGAALSEVPIRAGRSEISVTVRVTWSFA